MPKKQKLFIFILAMMLVFVPMLSLAQTGSDFPGLVPCRNDCNFNDLMTMINKIIDFVLFRLVLPICAIMFAYAGFLMLTSQGGEKKTKAKNIFTNAVFGLIIALVAWLIVNSILSILGYDGGWIGF